MYIYITIEMGNVLKLKSKRVTGGFIGLKKFLFTLRLKSITFKTKCVQCTLRNQNSSENNKTKIGYNIFTTLLLYSKYLSKLSISDVNLCELSAILFFV